MRIACLVWLGFALLGCGAGAATPGPEPATESATEADGDGDGVPDARDLCPRDTGPAETDGCPPLPRECPEGPFAILDTLEFAEGTARLAGRPGPILDAAAATLRGNPGVTLVEIRGHLSVEESPAGPALALERARVVEAELVSRGIAAARLRAVTLDARCVPGDSHPIPRARVDFRFLTVDGEAVVHDDECTRYPGEREAEPCE